MSNSWIRQHASSDTAQKIYKKSWFQTIVGGGGVQGSCRYMPDYYRYATYHHFLWSAILDFGLGINIRVWNSHKWILWPKLSLNWRITLLYQTGNDNFTTLPRPILKWPPTEFRPDFSEVGPRQIFTLTSNEMNKTIKPWSHFHGHGS